MRRLRQILFRLQLPFRRRRIEAELAEEIRTHLELATEANLAAGMSPEEAAAAARREFGGVDQVKESYRDERGLPGIEQLLQDIRYAARSLGRSPGFVAVSVLTLALGIGVNTTAFSFLNAVLFQRLPYPEPERLVRIYRTTPQFARGTHAPADLVDLQAGNDVFAQFAILDFPSFSLAEPGQFAERVGAFSVSGDYFAMMGVPPLLGRVFGPAEDRPGHNNVIVLSHRFWQGRFGGDRSILGRTLRLDGEPVTVIGVMPEEFHVPLQWGPRDIWRPLGLKPDLAKVRDGYWLQAVARLKPGVSLVQAQSAVDALAARLAHDHPLTNARNGFLLVRFDDKDMKQYLGMLMGLTGAVLLIACANLANLQLARNSRRAHEFAIRVALGGSRARLVRQLLTESLLLALLGGATGLLVAWGTNEVLGRRVAQLMQEPAFRLPLDVRVLGFALLAALATGLLFGLAPAWMLARVDASTGLKQAGTGLTAGRSRHRLRQKLIIGELSLTLGLMASAGYFVQAVQQMLHRDLGWSDDHLLTGRFALPGNRYGDLEKCRVFYERLNAELAAVPGVEQSVTCDGLPAYPFFNSRPVVPESAPAEAGQAPMTYVNMVSPGYFQALRMKLVQGRDFTARDRKGAPEVVIVNETLARQFWPGQNPIGQRIGGVDPAKRDWLEVVGVVNEVGYSVVPTAPFHLQIYRPLAQTGGSYFAVVARTSVPPETLTNALRLALQRIDPDQAVYDLTSVAQAVGTMRDFTFIMSTGLVVIAVSGLLLSTLGLYGVISNLVAERTREIGVRMALGAQVREIVWMVLRQGLRLGVIGVTAGAIGAVVMGRILATVQPQSAGEADPTMLILCAILLLAVTLLACWLPAHRAAKVDPLVALRAE